MAEENDDNTLASEYMEPGNRDMMENTGVTTEEAGIYVDGHKNLKDNIADDEIAEVADNTSDSVEEEDECLRSHDAPERVTGKPSSSGASNSAEGPLKKDPTAVIVGQNHKFTVRSRYRRASTGSCHDFCKYGHKHEHEPEKKTKRPLMGTIRETRPLARTASGDIRSVPDKETENKALHRRLSLPVPVLEKDPSTLSEDKHSSKRATPTQTKVKQIQTVTKPPKAVTLAKSVSRIKIDIPDVTKADRGSNSQDKSSQKVKEIKTKEEGGSYKKGEKEKAKGSMINSPRTALKKSPSIKALLVKNLKNFSRSRRQSDSGESKVNRSSDASEVEANMIESTDKKPPEKASKFSLSSEKAPNIFRGSRVAKDKGVKSNLKGTRYGLSSSIPEVADGETPRKSGSSRTQQNGLIREDGGSKTTTPRAKTVVNNNAKAKRTGVSRPEEKDGSAWKVKFRRGTVLNLQVASNSPKKLRFRKAKILGEDQNQAESVQTLKSVYDITVAPDAKPDSEKVKLRRQEAAAKKDSVDMNNVIEETASKLVKTRKSKVKALVGAFETVMSFRDRKPLVETSAS